MPLNTVRAGIFDWLQHLIVHYVKKSLGLKTEAFLLTLALFCYILRFTRKKWIILTQYVSPELSPEGVDFLYSNFFTIKQSILNLNNRSKNETLYRCESKAGFCGT